MMLSLTWMILGVGFYSYVMGNFASMLASIDSRNLVLKNKLMVLEKFSRISKLDDYLYGRIK